MSGTNGAPMDDDDEFLIPFAPRHTAPVGVAQQSAPPAASPVMHAMPGIPLSRIASLSSATVNLSSEKIRSSPTLGIDHSLLSFVEGIELGGRPVSTQSMTNSMNSLLRLLPGEEVMVQEEGAAQGEEQDMLTPLLRETSRHLRSIGHVNIVVAGQTGVGKSSLINAVFGEQFARTAAGEPVTQRAEWFSSTKIPLRILDTKGLEVKDYAGTVADLRGEIEACRAMKDAKDQLHIGWVCIAAPSSRVQEAELDVLRVLNAYNIPAIVILTKYDDDEEFLEIVENILTSHGITRHAVIPVRAIAKPRRPAYGLSDLVVSSFQALPTAHRAAFAAAQKVNLDLNKQTANEYVMAAAAAAAAAAVIPIPLADALSLAPIQTGMLVGVSGAFGLELDRQAILQLLTTVLGCVALSVAGRWAVGSALKLIPGPGSVIGGIMNASVAGSLTLTLGRIYIAFLTSFIKENGRVPLADEIVATFPTYYRTYSKQKAAAAEAKAAAAA